MWVNKKHYPMIAGSGILVLFFFTRLYHILAIPIFTDESIYVRWTQIFVANVHQFFVPLTDGKQPLFIWIGYPFVKFISNPLLGLRLVSVLAGLFTMIGIYFLTRELFKDKKTALVASLIYVIYPFSLLYDKLALYDSLLATFAVWSLYMEVLLVRRRKFRLAILTGLILGGGLLTKSSAFFYLYLFPFSLLLFDFRTKSRAKDFIKWLGLVAVATIVAETCYSVLRFSPIFNYISVKNSVFVYPFHAWLSHPFKFFISNMHLLLSILVGYSTIPLLIIVCSVFLISKKFTREKLLLLAWFVIPFVALAFFGKLILPRYILFMVMPLLALAAFSIDALLKKIKPTLLAGLIVLALLMPILYKDYFILTDFAKASLPKSDHTQFIQEGYTAGIGAQDTATLLKTKSTHQKIYIGTEGLFGLMPDSLQDYLNNDRNVVVEGFWPINSVPPQEVSDAAQTMPTYFVFYAPCPLCSQPGLAPKTWSVKKVLQITPSNKNGSYYTLYQLLDK